MNNGSLQNMRTCKSVIHLIKKALKSSHSLGQGGLSTHGDHRAEFYEDYHKVAKEYDKEFQKNRKDDLDTILIFVSSETSVDGHILIRAIGWSIFCCCHCIYYPVRLYTSA